MVVSAGDVGAGRAIVVRSEGVVGIGAGGAVGIIAGVAIGIVVGGGVVVSVVVNARATLGLGGAAAVRTALGCDVAAEVRAA